MNAAAVIGPALRSLRERRSVVLAYHGLGTSSAADDPHFLHVRPQSFRTHVELMLEAGFRFVPVSRFADSLGGGRPPAGLAALSFDDGMEDNHSVLLPLLSEYALPATVYACSGLLGGANPWLRGTRMMTEDELRAMAGAGVEIGSHGVTHQDMTRLGYDDCLREMTESRERLQELTGTPVESFAYPSCKYGEAAMRAARDAGFKAALTCQGRGSWERFELKRTMIGGKDGLPSFVAKLCGVYDPVFHSPPGRVARVATRGARSRARAALERRGKG